MDYLFDKGITTVHKYMPESLKNRVSTVIASNNLDQNQTWELINKNKTNNEELKTNNDFHTDIELTQRIDKLENTIKEKTQENECLFIKYNEINTKL